MRRRDASWAIMQAAALAGSGEFFSNWLKAAHTEKGLHLQHVHSQAPPEPNRWNAYQPAFFSAVDFRNLDAFAAILIPSDDTPGAREAHVAPFIDFVVNAAAEYAPEMQKEWRTAMEWLRAHEFSRLSPEEQVALVARLSVPERDRKQTVDGFSVYRLIKDMTVRAFYTSRAGLVDALEYKGLAYLTAFPACTHPEHHKI